MFIKIVKDQDELTKYKSVNEDVGCHQDTTGKN